MIAWPSPLELAAVAATVVCVWLARRNSVHTWWTGLVGVALYALVFFEARLYADVTLQAFFAITGMIGWVNWTSHGSQPAMEPARAPRRELAWYAAGALVVTFGYGALLSHFTNAWAPFVDSAVLALSVAAQLMLMRRQLETWPTWVAVNVLSVPLYWSRDLHVTAVVYAFFLVNALVAWRQWLDLVDEAEAARRRELRDRWVCPDDSQEVHP